MTNSYGTMTSLILIESGIAVSSLLLFQPFFGEVFLDTTECTAFLCCGNFYYFFLKLYVMFSVLQTNISLTIFSKTSLSCL